MIPIDTFNKIRSLIKKFSNITSVIAMVVIFAIMFVLVIDIILRLTTKELAVLGTYELTEMAMVVIIFLSLAITQIEKEHVHVTMFIDMLPNRIKTFINAIISAFTTVLCGITLYTCILQAIGETASGITTAVLYLPTGPFCWIMALGMFSLTLVLLFDTIDYFIKAIGNIPPEKKVEETLTHLQQN